jgi:tetratricopeptide (TPR) repeat protein
MRKNRFFVIPVFCFLLSVNLFSQTDESDPTSNKNPEDLYLELLTKANVKFDSANTILNMFDNSKSKKVAENLLKSALEDYQALLVTNPKSYPVHYKMGLTYGKLKKYKQAMNSLTIAIATDTSQNDPYRERALIEKERGKFNEAMADLDSAIYLNYDDYEAFYERGLLKESSKNKNPAISDYTKAIEINKDFSKPYFRRAVLNYTDVKDYLFANHDIMLAKKLDSTNLEIYYWLGKIKFNIADFKAAEKALTSYLDEKDSLNVDAIVTRGAARVNLNKYTAALADFNKVILKLDKKNYVAYMNRGLAYAGLGKNKEALADMDLAVKYKFDFSPIYINRALVKFKMRDKDGACADLRKAQSLNNAKADALLNEYCPK